MRYALKSFTPEPVSMRYKVGTLFHELLHIFLSRHPIENSALLKEHAAEDESSRSFALAGAAKGSSSKAQ